MMTQPTPRLSMRFLLPSVVLMIVQNIVSIFLMEVYALIFCAAYPKGAYYTVFIKDLAHAMVSADFLMATSLGFSIVGVAVFLPWFLHTKPKYDPDSPKDSLRFYPPYLIFGLLLLALASQYLSAFAIEVISYARPDWLEIYMDLLETSGLDGANGFSVITILYACILGPISEELCFRGLTFTYARSYMSFLSANLVQALLFGAIHMNPLQSVYTCVLGFLFGAIYEKTRNIYVTTLIHIAFNSSGMLLERYMVMGNTPVTFYLTLFGSLCAAYFAYQMILHAENTRRERLTNQATSDNNIS